MQAWLLNSKLCKDMLAAMDVWRFYSTKFPADQPLVLND